MRFSTFAGLAFALALRSLACSGADFSGLSTQGTGAGSAGSSSEGGDLGLSGSTGSLHGSGGGAGSPEVCDGIDNDGNGIVDDVDVGHDGVCDCLRIATLGLPGMWGQGDVFTAWLDSRSNLGATALNDQVLTKQLLDQFQVIVAEDLSKLNRTYSAAEVSALAEWVKAGGGFMTLIGYADSSEITNVNTLLASFGMSYGSQQVLSGSGGTLPVKGWVPHPVTQGVSAIGVDNGYPVQGAGTTLASEQGVDVLKAQEVSEGHVLLWGDEWITYDSEWSGHPDYQVELFWLNAIKWLTPAKDCQVAIPE